jgi:hypothetical protein
MELLSLYRLVEPTINKFGELSHDQQICVLMSETLTQFVTQRMGSLIYGHSRTIGIAQSGHGAGWIRTAYLH